MKKTPRIKNAIKTLSESYGFDKVIAAYDAGNFVELIVSHGGDTITWRVYNDGKIYER